MPPEDIIDIEQGAIDRARELTRQLTRLYERQKDVERGSAVWKEIQTDIGGAKKELEGLRRTLGTVGLRMVQNEEDMANFRKEMSLLGGELGSALGPLSEFSDKLFGLAGLTAVIGSNIGRNLINPLKGTKDIVGALPRPLQAINEVLRGQREILDLVNTSYAGFGRGMAASRITGRDLVREMGHLQQRFGFSRDVVKGFVESSKSLPFIMDAIGKSTGKAGEGATELSDLLHALRGAGMDVTKSGQLMTDLYAKFGTRTAPEAAQQILTFARAAKTTGINIEFVQKHLVAASQPLAIFGQKADVAARTWTTFTDALKNTLPIEEIGKIVNTVTGNIAKMSFQTRAFVAQMSGMAQGVSALGGALRMELELRGRGGLERNLQRVTRMLARFGGGRITTLEEAVRNPALEMQFQLQRQLVGQTLGVQGQQEQARVLEVLQRVQRGGISNLDAQKTMANLTKSGRDIQKASLTALERMVQQASESHTVLEAMKGIETAMAGDIERMAATLGRGRAQRAVTPQEERLTGLHARRALQAGGRETLAATGRLMGTIRRQAEEFGAGLAGRPPPGVTTERPSRVRPLDPATRLLAERRRERVMPAAPAPERPRVAPLDIEAIIGRQPRRERRETPTEIFPYPEPRRRIEPPAGGMPAPPAAAPAPAAGTAPGAAAAPAAAGEAGAPQAAATNITVGVVCERCHEEMVRKTVAELSEQRDQHIQGVVTGKYST